jgi:hypothetical protein
VTELGPGEVLRAVVERLDAAAIPFMVTGSFASALHGEPRTTHDIDIVIDPPAGALERFVASLPDDVWYVDIDTATDAVRRRSMFNVIDLRSGWKVDFIVRKERPFSVEEFARRVPAELHGVAVFATTPEDAIVAKLEWAAKAESERQLRDVVGIVQVQGDALDVAYADRWARALGVEHLWARVRPAIGD